MGSSQNSDSLRELLNELRAKHNVVGATLGVLEGDTIETAASGLLSLETQVDCTPQSVFQIGSIGKVFTTTLIMQLVDEGRLDLDDPVVRHLRDFTLADPKAARAVTVRQLLNHTSGMDGDFFPADDPEGPSTASYVRKMALLPSLYPPGMGPVTYCNSGFVTAGRVAEVLTGRTWASAVTSRILRPLGVQHAFADPRDSIRFRCAMGHVADPSDMKKTLVAPATFLSLSAAAAGAVLSMSVESLLMFARVHLADGLYGDGKRLLSEASARRMREPSVPAPPFSGFGTTHWGLGWCLSLSGDYQMAGHNGGTIGQFAYLRAYPRRGTAFALLTNSPSLSLFEAIDARLEPELAGATHPEDPPRTDFAPRFERYVGRYENVAAIYQVEAKDNGLSLRTISKWGFPGIDGMLEPWCEDAFSFRSRDSAVDGMKITFVGEDKARPAEFIRQSLRMARRVG